MNSELPTHGRAVTYYRNKVYNCVGAVNYKKEIKKQLVHWNKWY